MVTLGVVAAMGIRACGRAVVLALVLSFLLSWPVHATISPKDEVEMGRAVAEVEEAKYGLCKDAATESRVQRVGARIVAGLDKTMYPYQFRTLASPDINAFACPGGFIFIYYGLTCKLPTDDALAFVLAHEVAHAANRHYAQRLAKLERVAALAIGVSIVARDTQGKLAQNIIGMVSAGYSRDDERGSDAAALRYMRQAGYSTDGALVGMRVLAELEGGAKRGSYLATHPPAAHRLDLLTAQIDQYEKENTGKASTQASGAASPQIEMTALVGKVPEVARAANPYYPLAVGSEWRYKVEAAGTSLSYTVRLAGSIPLADGDIFREETKMGESVSSRQVFTTAHALWQRNQLSVESSPWVLEAVITDDETQFLPADGWDHARIGKEELSLPCGQFKHVLHVRKRRTEEPNTAFDIWYAPGVGMVKRVDAKTGYVEVLQSYKQGSAAR